MPGLPPSNDYVQRVNRAIDFLSRHLDEAPSLDVMAAKACFSPYHFHRIFKAVTGETVHAYARRVRLGRAAQKLRAVPTARATDVALEYGFASLSDLSRAFKADGWLMLRNGEATLGLFQGKFEDNFLTFNPPDVRGIQARLQAQGVPLMLEADMSTTGPASAFLKDPDGNGILLDQHEP